MGWHIQFTRATARYFRDSSQPAETSFAKRVSPDVIAQVDLTSDGKAYIHATMSRQDGATALGVWRELARQLRAFGVAVLDWEHNGKASSREAQRAFQDTVAIER